MDYLAFLLNQYSLSTLVNGQEAIHIKSQRADSTRIYVNTFSLKEWNLLDDSILYQRLLSISSSSDSSSKDIYWGRSLSVHVNFGSYNFGTWVFDAVNFGTLNVNFGTCHVRYMTDQLRYMSVSVHSATMTDIPSCCVLDSRHRKDDLLPLKAYVQERSRRVLFKKHLKTHLYKNCFYTV